MTPSLHAFTPLLAKAPNAELWSNPVDGLLVSVALIISAVGVAVILWGAYCSVLRLIALETAAARGQLPKTDAAAGRLLFATYLLPGLDFLIAGGVIKTLAVSDWQQAAVLGGIVMVRTLLGLGMKWEAASACVEESPAAGEGVAAPADSPEATNKRADTIDVKAAPAAGERPAPPPASPGASSKPTGDLAAVGAHTVR
jgi:uncharacterized membrane protein